jgi:hypothetical protein
MRPSSSGSEALRPICMDECIGGKDDKTAGLEANLRGRWGEWGSRPEPLSCACLLRTFHAEQHSSLGELHPDPC